MKNLLRHPLLKTKRVLVTGCICLTLLPAQGEARGEKIATLPASSPDTKSSSAAVRKLLQAVDTAARHVPSAAYVAESRQTNAIEARVFKVKVQKIPTEQKFGGRLSVSYKDLTVSYDGEQMYRSNAKGSATLPAESGKAFLDACYDTWIHFLHPNPFQDELDASVATIEGQALVDGQLCDIVYVAYVNGQKARWYFSKRDSLPRHVDRLNPTNGQTILSTTLKNLQTGLSFGTSDFILIASDQSLANDNRGFSETAAKHLGRIYLLSNPALMQDFVPYLKEHKSYFTENGESIRLAQELGPRLVRAGIKAFDPNAYERAVNTGGPTELAGKVADSINKGAVDLFTMGQELIWLAKVLPPASRGDLEPYLSTGTELRQMARVVMSLLGPLLELDPSNKAILDQVTQLFGPIYEDAIIVLARALNFELAAASERR